MIHKRSLKSHIDWQLQTLKGWTQTWDKEYWMLQMLGTKLSHKQARDNTTALTKWLNKPNHNKYWCDHITIKKRKVLVKNL